MAFVQTPANKFRLHFVDAAGKRATSDYYVSTDEDDPGAGGCAAIADAAADLSNDFLESQEIIVRAVEPAPANPVDGPYSRGADKLKLTLSTANGTPVKLNIGGPKATDFVDGTIDVDTSDANVAALITALKTHACDAEGGAITGLTLGYRSRPANRKKQ